MCVLPARALASVRAFVSMQQKGLRALARANLSKQVFVIAGGWMTFGASLESFVTSCGEDRGESRKELTKK